ncbi:MAG TPA: hypothetical protein VNJ03_05340 [Vicinamibacterales bacterium]|nr:hypothetical protein [Vicinamibacterales bacterium]
MLASFVMLATLNSGGYRYGASDQAFYQPAVLANLDPARFPRDGSLIAAQAQLTLMDESIGAVARATGLPLPHLFLSLYVTTLALLAAGAWMIARRLYRSVWTCLTLLAALTLRHAVARSGTNTLEGYFHPRQLAFAFGALGVAAFLRGRRWPALLCVVLACSVHPTTALWFAVWLGVATLVADRSARVPLAVAATCAAGAGAWALTVGPLAGRLEPMDAAWLATLRTKDYLFPLGWPAYAWAFNLSTAALVAGLYRLRARAGLVDIRERGLFLGCLSLGVIFFIAVLLQTMNVALSIQLQPARTFWMFDFLATIYVVWALAEGRAPTSRRAVAALVVVLAFSAVRGVYVLLELDREPFRVDVPDDDWGRVMRWARTTPKDSGWLADPMHAVTYGTSVRVAGERDVFVEGVKDAAIGMYDRDVALRTAERLAGLPDFAGLTGDDAQAMASRYGLDYIVTPAVLDLPVAFESGTLRVYRLR